MTNAQLDLRRRKPVAGSILGELWLNGTFFCYTLERQAVAIPTGNYQVLLNQSPTFRRLLPQLLGGDVTAGQGVYLRPGTTKADTEACVLVGLAHLPSGTTIYRTEEAFVALMNRLLPATTIELTIH